MSIHPSWEAFRLEVERQLGESYPEEMFWRVFRGVAADLNFTREDLSDRARQEEFGAAMGLALFREKLS